ncbi:hypothetical protein JST97_20365 [bacterium]|nr:hypothetical protein [bacterium]
MLTPIYSTSPLLAVPPRERRNGSLDSLSGDSVCARFVPASVLESASPAPRGAQESLSLLGHQAEVANRALQGPESSGWIEATGGGAGVAADASSGAGRASAAVSNGLEAGKVAKALGKVAPAARVAGPVGGIVATGAQVAESGLKIREVQQNSALSEADKEQQTGQLAVQGAGKIGGGLAGMAGGMAAGASLGAVGGPAGMAVGLIAGAVLGGLGGDWLGGKLGDGLGGTGLGRLVGKAFA